MRFLQQWYLFFNSIFMFLAAVRNAPQSFVQANLAAFSQKLTTKNTGIQVWILAPYNHMLRWSGAAWEFAPGDLGSDYYVTGMGAGLAPGFHSADGSDSDYLLPNGTTAPRTLVTAANTWYRR